MSSSSAHESPALLALEGVSKTIAGRAVLDAVDLQVGAGEIVVLLGPNGAGKTTLLGIACGRVAPDAGRARIVGADPRRSPSARGHLGLVPQELGLYAHLTVVENLRTFARMMGVARGEIPARVDEALAWSGLEARGRDLVSVLSGGMRRRLNIVASLLHRPSVLLLDEPTVGVDVHARERIHALLRGLRGQGLGLLLTTHDLPQAAALADRVVFLVDGRVRLEGAPATLVSSVYGTDRQLVVTLAAVPDCSRMRTLQDWGLRAGQGGLVWTGRVSPGLRSAVEWEQRLEGLALEVSEVRVQAPTLEAVFLRLTGEELVL